MNNPLDKVRERLPPAPTDLALVNKQTGKPLRVPAKLKEFFKLLLTGECTTIKAACSRVGYSNEYISRRMRQPHILNYIDQQVKSRLAEGKLVASARLVDLIHAKSEHVSFDASVHTLAVNGIAAPQANVSVLINNNISPGYVIDLSPGDDAAERTPRTIEHEPQGGE